MHSIVIGEESADSTVEGGRLALQMAHITVDRKMFVVDKFSSVPYSDENEICEIFSTANNKNMRLARAMKIKQHKK